MTVDPHRILVADTSAVINLLASGNAEAILRALPNQIVITNAVVTELGNGNKKGRTESAVANILLAEGLISVVRLNDQGAAHFERLVVGPAHLTLDDGEAATIAFAAQTSAIAVIDERKATRLCNDCFPTVRVLSTLDILAREEVLERLGDAGLADALFNALFYGRMNVPQPHVPWVVSVIGDARAAKCNSLSRVIRRSTSNAGPNI